MKEDVEEITWQTYTGELTPKQEKTKEKVLKRLEKVSFFIPNVLSFNSSSLINKVRDILLIDRPLPLCLIFVWNFTHVQIGHMKKEIAAIRAKDISQGGLTQGQQTQIARNDQRTAEVTFSVVFMEW